MKTCRKCLVEYDESFFNKRPRGKNGINAQCKNCTRAQNKKQGKPKRPLGHDVWRGMLKRCDYKKAINYHNYGGRGITYDPKWRTYGGFWEDMGPSFVPGLTLDRIDNDGNYSKENCRWATWREQSANRRNARIIEMDGESKILAEWCRLFSVNYYSVRDRMNTGSTLKEAIAAAKRRNT